MSRVFLIAGPTASGKSVVALALAERTGAWVVNADALQVYAGWQVLTARPDAEEEARAPHKLYGFLDPSQRSSAGDWLRAVQGILADARAAERDAVIVGGTGLHFSALTKGLAEIPPVPDAIRNAAEAMLAKDGADALRAALLAKDPAAARLDLENPRRVLRAWEVLQATGRSITAYADETPPPLLPPTAIAGCIALIPDRDTTNARIETRFRAMVEGGALTEAEAMLARNLDPALPAMKAVGAPPLFAYLQGDLDYEAAIERGVIDTRRYAKRQRTWLRNQLGHWPVASDADEAIEMLMGGSKP